MKYRLYTDGSSHARSDLPGGWAWLLLRLGAEQRVVACQSGGEAKTSNNRMELTGIMMGVGTVASGLDGCSEDLTELEVVSDSQYALGVASGRFNATTNQDLVLHIREEVERLRRGGIVVDFSWTRGHAGEPWNERVDRLATRAKARVAAVAQIDFDGDL